MRNKTLIFVASAAALLSMAACTDRDAEAPQPETPAAEAPATAAPIVQEPSGLPRSEAVSGASAYFITPEDGANVSNPVDIEFGISGMTVVPAGVNQPHSGHHHLLIDTQLPALDQPIPADANHIHFGDGSTSTQLTLEPGEHTLLLLLGDHLHIPHDPPVTSATITITVQ
jgi:hypothetical protein